MITERDLEEAIAECQGVRNPNASTCIKLAAYLTIQEALYGKQTEEAPMLMRYSNKSDPVEQIENTIEYTSDTEFSAAIQGRNAWDIWGIMDELMSVLQATNPRLYNGVMRKIED